MGTTTRDALFDSVCECKMCGSYNLTAKDSRVSVDGIRRRRRQCLDCGVIFTTYEIRESDYKKLKVFMTEFNMLKSQLEVLEKKVW